MKKWLSVMGVAVLLLVLPCGAVIPAWDMTDTFVPSGGASPYATVHSWVNPVAGAAPVYSYNYEITFTSANINWFSVELGPDAQLTGAAPTTTPTPGGKAPLLWDFMDDPISSIAALFQPQIPSGGHSYILSFESYKTPIVGDAMVSGITAGRYNSMTGEVYTPVPEPTTMALLALGLGLAARRKK